MEILSPKNEIMILLKRSIVAIILIRLTCGKEIKNSSNED